MNENTNYKQIEDIFVELGKLKKDQLEDILKSKKDPNKKIEAFLIDNGIITNNDLTEAFEIQLGIQKVKISDIEFDDKVIKLLPEVMDRKYTLIPFKLENNILNVLMWDPLNLFAIEDIKVYSGYDIKPFLAEKAEISAAIEKFYSSSYVQKAVDDLNKEQISPDEKQTDEQAEENIKNAPVVKLVESIINNAARKNASDIHIEPFEEFFKVRYRIDGKLQEVIKNTMKGFDALVTRIMLLANLNIAEKRIPQDGRIITDVDGKAVDLRVSVFPTIYGIKIVIRLLRREEALLGKSDLHLYPDDLVKLNSIIDNPHGMILVTGPTGSGKSTTLYSILSDLNKPDVNIVTVEDPVEYMIEGINQGNINAKAGLTFAACLRSILRQDPDIIMIGEIRDKETAEMAIRSAITGHLVLSTIHTNDAPSTIMRLEDMDIEKYLISSSVVGIIAQRLVRTICPKCKIEYDASENEKVILGLDNDNVVKLHKGTGCKYCNNIGYKGRTAIFEIMEMNRNIRDAVIHDMSSDELNNLAIKNGMKSLKMFGVQKVLDGVTTVNELLRVVCTKDM